MVHPGFAVSQETTTTLLSDVGAIKSGETINFTVWVFSGYDPVPTGSIKIIDLNSTGEAYSTIVNGKSVVSWLPESYEEGIHTFQVEYQGFPGFDVSFGMCKVYFEDFSPGSSKTTSITLESNSTVCFKNKSINFTVTLYLYSQTAPWGFRGGFIYVKNQNLTGTPTIHTYGPLPDYYPGTNPAVMSYTLNYTIPIFHPTGKTHYIAEYTGSSQSQSQPCFSDPNHITVMSTGFWLIQSVSQEYLQREEATLELNTTILGDNPFGLELRSYYYLQSQKVVFYDQIVGSRNVTTSLSPSSSIPVGPLSIITELVDFSTGLQYVNNAKIVTIVDRARIDHSVNVTEYRHNETIRFEIYITEEDVWTHPIISQVELIDLTDGNRSVLNKTTNQDGFVVMEFLIPDNSTVGSHQFAIRTDNTSEFIIDTTKIISINIKGLTDIILNYGTGIVIRNSIAVIGVTVLSGGVTVSEGSVSLEFSLNGSVIETKNCEPGLSFQYFIKSSHPLGVMSYQIHFFNSSSYEEQIKAFDLTVFSTPSFNSIGQNTTTAIKGQTVRIWGELLDEIGQPVINEEVELTDTTIGMDLGKLWTDDQGIFYFDYYISSTIQIGMHFIEINYFGNPLSFYDASINRPITSLIIRPPLSVLIETEVLSEHWTVISLEGGLFDDVIVEWQKEGQFEWTFLAIVALNGTGIGSYNWTTPYYKGGFSIKASGPNSTKYDFAAMYTIPRISVGGGTTANVNDKYYFIVNSSERYQIWVENQLFHDWQQAGYHSYEYTFTSRGMKDISIISNDSFVYYNEYHQNITVFEEVIISLSVPSESFINVTVNIDGTVYGEVSGPLSGFDTILLINGTEEVIDSTNGAGNYYFTKIFDQPGYYSILVKTLKSETDFFSISLSEEVGIFVHSLPPNISILSPLNEATYSSIVGIKLSGNAVNYWYRIDPVDTFNISWVTPVYRTLSEGSYFCHVYGQNSFGIINYISSSFTIDATAPSLVIISPVNKSYNTNSIILSYITDESNVFVFLDGSLLMDAEPDTVLNDLPEGNHNLTITSEDLAGNRITRTTQFSIDTILPSLEIFSPYNQSYTGQITITISSNGSTILYYIPGIFPYNQSYKGPITVNLSLGYYFLQVYAFDEAGNEVSKSVGFSIVEKINLLINSGLEDVDGAGNYVIYTQIMNHPDFDTIGLLINGTYDGDLVWNGIFKNYRRSFQLTTSGTWEITLYAKTTHDEYDFNSTLLEWDPPAPEIESFAVTWESSYFEIQVQLDSGSLQIERVQASVDSSIYELKELYLNRWFYYDLPFNPRNMTMTLSVWYAWDVNPSVVNSYPIQWFAPAFQNEGDQLIYPQRNNFTLKTRILKQNASLNSEKAYLALSDGSQEFNISGTYQEPLSKSYQDWEFVTIFLSPGLWNYSLHVFDVFGVENILSGTFNNTDTPPEIGNVTVIQTTQNELGGRLRIIVPVRDDYQISTASLNIDGSEIPIIYSNDTCYVFEIWLPEDTYIPILSVYDDLNQESSLILPSIQITSIDIISTTNTFPTTSSSTNSTLSPPFDDHSDGYGGGGVNSLIELGLAGSIFGGLIAAANVVNRKRRA
jgi:hypothetical protein